MAPPTPVIVSACIVGLHTRFDGATSSVDVTAKGCGELIIPLCPEILGGLATPRARAEITPTGSGDDVLEGSSRVVDELGRDVTKNFIDGARATLEIARLVGAKRAILKERSPSCGVKAITREGKEIPGVGVTAALLKREGLTVEGV